jgi:hypothetical protein
MQLNIQNVVKNRINTQQIQPTNDGANLAQLTIVPANDPLEAFKQQDYTELEEAHSILGTFIRHIANGKCRGLLLNGPAGIGKTNSVSRLLAQHGNQSYKIVAGNMSVFNLYMELYRHREQGEIVVLDDIDGIFKKIDGINILKAATDTTKQRRISWITSNPMLKVWGIPNAFDYNGGIIVISNEELTDRNGRLGLHLAALSDRLHHLSLGTDDKKEQFLQLCYYVVKHGLLSSRGLDEEQQNEILMYITQNFKKLPRISLRTATNLADLMILEPKQWKVLAKHSLLTLDSKEGY